MSILMLPFIYCTTHKTVHQWNNKPTSNYLICPCQTIVYLLCFRQYGFYGDVDESAGVEGVVGTDPTVEVLSVREGEGVVGVVDWMGPLPPLVFALDAGSASVFLSDVTFCSRASFAVVLASSCARMRFRSLCTHRPNCRVNQCATGTAKIIECTYFDNSCLIDAISSSSSMSFAIM